jgi:nitric oxide reductase subunit C
MLTKHQARIFFIGGTGIFAACFLALTVDTMRKIPAQTHSDKITPAVERGKHIWEDNNCMGCHTLFGEGAYYAPELTKVVERRGAAWMKIFLKDPEKMFPGQRKMVNYHFTDAQAEDVIAFLDWCGKVDLNGFPAKPPLQLAMQSATSSQANNQATARTIPAVFEQKTCLACHQLLGRGMAGLVIPSATGEMLAVPALDEVYKPKTRA